METRLPITLRPGERLLDTVRADCVPMIPWMFFLFVWIATPFFFLYPLWKEEWLGMGIFFTLTVSGLLMAWRTYYAWQRSVCMATDQRLIEISQRGFFDRQSAEVEYSDVEEVTYRVRGLLATVFRFGAVRLRTAGQAADIEIRRVHQPARLANLLNDLRKEARRSSRNFYERPSGHDTV